MCVFWIAEGRTAGFVLEGCPHTLSWEDLSHPAVPFCNRYLILSHNLSLPCPFSVVLIEEQYPRFSMEIWVHTSILIGMSNLISICSHMILGLIKQLGWLIGLIFVVTANSRCKCPWQRVFLFFLQRLLSTFDVFILTSTSPNALQYCSSKALPNADVVWLFPRPGTVLTVQALSEDDHKFWMQAMGGKEPVSQPPALCHHLPLTLGSLYSVQLPSYRKQFL